MAKNPLPDFSLPTTPDFTAACDYLQQARKFGLKLGLETMEELATALGNPEQGLNFIHIAGTNGKGSTAAFCASVLQEVGARVGLYTSPHLCSITERIRVNGQPISQEDFAAGIQIVQHLALQKQLNPTFFEILTALALWYFQKQRIDWVVWETGLGGSLDATNVVVPAVSIISNIGLDHTQYLGTTLEAIAREKAGIIKPGVPVVTAVSEPESLRVIEEVSRKLGSSLIRVGKDLPVEVLSLHPDRVATKINHHDFNLSLSGSYQALNAACAYGALNQIRFNGQPIHIEEMQRGFAQAQWPGRFQLLRKKPPFVIDGAHNVDAVRVLIQSWNSVFNNQAYHLVFGSLSDKPFTEMAQLLRGTATRVTLVGVPSERTVTPDLLRPLFDGLPVQVVPNLENLWPALESDPMPILLTGSLFLVGQALSLSNPTQYPTTDLALNERLVIKN